MKLKYILLIITGVLSQIHVFSQYCEPQGSCFDGDMINSFTFNTISNKNSGCGNTSNGYSNTGLSTTVTKGNSYNLTIQSGSSWKQGFSIWIDYNIDGDFNDPNEMVYTSGASSTEQFTGSITIPNSASTGSTRMRVRCKYGDWFKSSESCVSVGYGETEDYTINIEPANIAPEANFSVNTTSTCDGTIVFTDQSKYAPTTWLWYFGDGSTSTTQNPAHTYTSDGNFTVSLVVTNQFGSDSISFVNYISVNLSGNLPVTAGCIPSTVDGSKGFGITHVQFNTINNYSQNASLGYENFTCFSTTVMTGKYYNISIATDQPAPHNVKVWIDLNNDGNFNNDEELVLVKSNTLITNDSILIQDIAVTDTPLRMRISADHFIYTNFDACTNLQYGQAEDYSIIIEENTNPPVANFTQSSSTTCDGTVSFNDISDNVPVFWFWDFGDGTSSNDADPTHTYSDTGRYDVTLIVSNSYGGDTITKKQTIFVNFDGQLVNASCTPTTSTPFSTYGIFGVYLNEIENVTSGSFDNYQDYSCEQNTTLGQDGCYELTVRTGPNDAEDVRAWLDFNNDGIFDNNELVFESLNAFIHKGKLEIPQTGVVNDIPLRLRISSDVIGNIGGPCDNVQWGQIEDYAVIIASNNPAPSVFFTADETISCDGNVNFTDESCGAPTSWFWDFGDGEHSTEQNPNHQYTNPGNYDVTLYATNNKGTNSTTKGLYIKVLSLFGTPGEIDCTPGTNNPIDDMGIFRFRFYTIDNTTSGSVDSYEDYTCSQQTVLSVGQNVPLEVKTSSIYAEDVYIWIDYDNNNQLNFNELAFTSIGKYSIHNGSITIPATATLNTPLRMRVMDDFSQGNSPGSCSSPDYGQVEDYTVLITAQNAGPIASFTSDSAGICMGTVHFINNSSASATSFFWDFGDGTTSDEINPVHTYKSVGTYSVKLIAYNSNGNDEMKRNNYIFYYESCDMVGINEQNNNNEIQVNLFPNPTNGILNIDIENNNDENYSLTIYNIVGEIIFQETTTGNYNQKIDMITFNKGIYMFTLTSETSVITKKIIVE